VASRASDRRAPETRPPKKHFVVCVITPGRPQQAPRQRSRSSRGLDRRFGAKVRSTGTQVVQSPIFSRIAAADLGIPDRADDGSRARFSFSPDRNGAAER